MRLELVWPVFGAVEDVTGGTVDDAPDGPTVVDEESDGSPPVGPVEVEGVEDEGIEGVSSSDRSLPEHPPARTAATARPTTHLVRRIARRT